MDISSSAISRLSAKIADSNESKLITCKHSTIEHEQIHKSIKSNLLSLTVGFDQIDGSYNKDNKLNLQKIRVSSHSIGIVKACYDHESAGDCLNCRCEHSMQSEAMFDHKRDLLIDNFRSIVLTVGVGQIDGSHNSSSKLDLINLENIIS